MRPLAAEPCTTDRVLQIGVRAILENGGELALPTPNDGYDPEYKSEARVW